MDFTVSPTDIFSIIRQKKGASKLFSRTRGMWKDYDIEAKELRRQAWKLDR
jgi:hypothetical protein